jgi:hypothetical protein
MAIAGIAVLFFAQPAVAVILFQSSVNNPATSPALVINLIKPLFRDKIFHITFLILAFFQSL